jgi:hypothetical protein
MTEAILREATGAYADAFGDRLLAAFALGSLAHGGFSPLVSDVDLGLILRDPLRADDESRVAAVADRRRAGGSELHQRLSVFWGTRATLTGEREGGRSPPLDRLDLLQHGRLLAEHLVPVYLHFIDDHRARLAAAGRDDLAQAYGQWRDQLAPG